MSLFSDLSGAIGGVVALVLFVGVIALLRSLIRVCPSNHILVVTGGTETVIDGRKFGFRIQKGGWTYVVPFIQSVQAIDLTIIPINVRVEGVNSANGIDVGADATACVIIDDESETLLYSAIQQLLGKPLGLIQEQIQQTMVGNFRAALNKTTPLQAIGMVESAEGVDDVELIAVAEAAFGKGTVRQAAEGNENSVNLAGETDYGGERAIFRRLLLEDCREDLSAFGIDVVSVSLPHLGFVQLYRQPGQQDPLPQAPGCGDRRSPPARPGRSGRVRRQAAHDGGPQPGRRAYPASAAGRGALPAQV